MKIPMLFAASALVLAPPSFAHLAMASRHAKAHSTRAPRTPAAAATDRSSANTAHEAERFFHPSEVRSTGTVIVGGQPINYDAVAGTLVVHAKGWEDTDRVKEDADASSGKSDKGKNEPKPEASIYYAAYFKQGAPVASRPVTFLFNGGPGSSSVWLHMGAFGAAPPSTP